MSLTLAPPTIKAPEDETFIITGLSWDQYVTINDALGDRAGLRVLYLDGRLTFVSPAYVHEWSEDAIDKIILAIVVGCQLAMRPIGSTTLRKLGQGGLEGDRVYYLGANAAVLQGVAEIDLTVLPPPDLAIEVENTHKATDAMAIYAHLGVREVWRHDVRRATLEFWMLGTEGTYGLTNSSLNFPFLTSGDVLRQIQRVVEIASYGDWYQLVTEWVRDEIRPRLDQH